MPFTLCPSSRARRATIEAHVERESQRRDSLRSCWTVRQACKDSRPHLQKDSVAPAAHLTKFAPLQGPPCPRPLDALALPTARLVDPSRRRDDDGAPGPIPSRVRAR